MSLPKPLKILLITSGQPALNPRLVKEADALTTFGYDVTVLYSYWNEWGTNFDKQLLPKKKWKAVCVGGDPVYNKLIFFASRIIHRFAGQLNRVGIRWFADWAIARSSFFLVREARKYTADLYIGHNLGSLPAVVQTAQLHHKPCGFDAEDFHRNEVTDDPLNKNVLLKTYLEDKYIPHLNFITASSPLIAAEYQKLYPRVKKEVVLNVFPSNSGLNIKEISGNKALKIFWFSQTIGTNRGIEDAIDALNTLNESSFELHLLGDVSENVQIFFTERLKNKSKLFFHEPIAPDHIIEFASQFDIGLALENKTPFNRDICLTNKIFSYIQSGLAVIASDTTAQAGLLKQYPTTGKLYITGNVQSLADILSYYQLNRDNLFKTRNASLQVSLKLLNWEIESKKLLSVINLVI